MEENHLSKSRCILGCKDSFCEGGRQKQSRVHSEVQGLAAVREQDVCGCTCGQTRERGQNVRGSGRAELKCVRGVLESSACTYWAETVLEDDPPSTLLFKQATGSPSSHPTTFPCLVLWEGSGWQCQNLGNS